MSRADDRQPPSLEEAGDDRSRLNDRSSIPCVQCGYDLRGSVASEQCPECGLPTKESIANPTLVGLSPAFRVAIKTMARDCQLVLVLSICIAIAEYLLVLANFGHFDFIATLKCVPTIAMTWGVPFLIFLFGVWRLTRGQIIPSQLKLTARMANLFAILIAGGTVAAMIMLVVCPGSTVTWVIVLTITPVGLGGMAGGWAFVRFCMGIAKVLDDPVVKKNAWACFTFFIIASIATFPGEWILLVTGEIGFTCMSIPGCFLLLIAGVWAVLLPTSLARTIKRLEHASERHSIRNIHRTQDSQDETATE